MDAPAPSLEEDAAATASPAAALMVCEHCDTVYQRRPLGPGEVSRCLRCHAVLQRYQWLGVDGLLAMILTAAIAFLIANVWPIVTLGLSQQKSSVTLWGMIIAMWNQHSQVVSVLAAATLFFFPLVKMSLLGWVLWHARHERRAPGFGRAMVVLHYVQPWTMTEVFVLGALVAIVKAHAYFEVAADPGIFAYGVLMLLITLLSGVDLRQLWDLKPEAHA